MPARAWSCAAHARGRDHSGEERQDGEKALQRKARRSRRRSVEAEKERESSFTDYRLSQEFNHIDESIAMATMFTAYHLNVKAIAALTESGYTALWMSRLGADVPIYALTPEVDTRRKVTLFRGVYPINLKTSHQRQRTGPAREAEDELRRRGAVRDGDLILLTIGEPVGKSGGTNTMKIVRVGADQPDLAI